MTHIKKNNAGEAVYEKNVRDGEMSEDDGGWQQMMALHPPEFIRRHHPPASAAVSVSYNLDKSQKPYIKLLRELHSAI